VVVLGGGSGLGRACALEFAREGACVTIFGRDGDRLAAVAGELSNVGPPAAAVLGDIGVRADVERVMETAASRTGGVYALFNNGGGPQSGSFADFGDEQWYQAFELMLLSYVRAIRACLPFMSPGAGGRIMNNTSSGVKSALDSLILSNVFRLGVLGLTRSLASELAAGNVLVNAVAAGRIATDRVATLDRARAARVGTSPAEVRRAAELTIPLGRYGQPDELARTVVFHCSAANTYVTGQTFVVDGGMYRGY